LLHAISAKTPLLYFLYLMCGAFCDAFIATVIELQRFVEMILRLKDIATASSGVIFRSRIEASMSGNVSDIISRSRGQNNAAALLLGRC